MFKKMVFLLALLVLTTSCATRSQTGAVGGSAAGALIGQAIGHDTEATLLGAAVGGLLGYIIGNEMDKYDRGRLTSVYDASPSYSTTTWVNPDSGREYAVTPQPAYTNPATDRVCREAEIVATIEGKTEKTVATACRDQYGRWVIQ